MSIPFLDVGAAYSELREELDDAYRRVMHSGRYILGDELEAFEAEFAQYCGSTSCVGVANGLDALHLMLRASGIGPGDEVLVPANTYIATWLAVSHAGATPVPVEPDPSTFNLDPARLEAEVTPRTRAIIAVHLYGLPAEMDAIAAVARRHGLLLFEDAAQAHGAGYKGRRAGGLSDAAAFSFYPGKNLGAFGDAGAIVTRRGDLAASLRRLRNYGSEVKYVNEAIGFNSRLDPLQAAFLRVRLKHLDEWNRRRIAIASRYLSAFQDVPNLRLPTTPVDAAPAWHLFVVRHPDRDRLRDHLNRRHIETLIHYPIPPHASKAYAGSAAAERSLPITDELSATVISLPIGPHMSDEQVAAVTGAVSEFADAGTAVG